MSDNLDDQKSIAQRIVDTKKLLRTEWLNKDTSLSAEDIDQIINDEFGDSQTSDPMYRKIGGTDPNKPIIAIYQDLSGNFGKEGE